MKRNNLSVNFYLALLLVILLPTISLAQENMSNSTSIEQQLQFVRQMQAEDQAANRSTVDRATVPTTLSPIDNQQKSDSNTSTQTPIATQQMVQAAPSDLEQGAFQSAAKQLLPLSPAQIHRLRQLYDQSQYAASAEPGVPPQPSATSRFVSLAPGATPPVIRLAAGFITSLVFLDSTGQAWPIDSYDLGNPAAFDIQWNRKDNVLMVQAKSYYTYGNLAVRLKNKETPVMITLIPGQQAVDYRVDLRVQGLGPNASAPIGDSLPSQPNPELLNVLDGVPPTGSQHLSVTGGEADAWVVGDKMFIRTRLTILSPSWTATMQSADGTRAYEIQKTPLILVSEHGKVMQLKVEGF